ncbi:MAG: DUF2177 family protein [Saprospiraceae bacterium]|nr:DUF2177 family protein [Saprospiraceae bacterium]
MPVTKWVTAYFLTTLVFFAIDLTWLGLIAKSYYNRHLGHLMAEQVIWSAAIVFYLIFIVGIFLFVIAPAVEKQSWTHALLYGALFGLFTYATYDLTNLATLKGWPMSIVFVDILWGMFLTGAVSVAGYFITRWLKG